MGEVTCWKATQILDLALKYDHLAGTMPLGGCGAFSLLTVVFPDLIRDLYELCERGDFAAAKPLQYQLSPLLLTIKQFKMHSATKALFARLTEIGVWPTRSLAQAA